MASQPRSRVMAYFHIWWSKYEILIMHVLKKNALHVVKTLVWAKERLLYIDQNRSLEPSLWGSIYTYFQTFLRQTYWFIHNF